MFEFTKSTSTAVFNLTPIQIANLKLLQNKYGDTPNAKKIDILIKSAQSENYKNLDECLHSAGIDKDEAFLAEIVMALHAPSPNNNALYNHLPGTNEVQASFFPNKAKLTNTIPKKTDLPEIQMRNLEELKDKYLTNPKQLEKLNIVINAIRARKHTQENILFLQAFIEIKAQDKDLADDILTAINHEQLLSTRTLALHKLS